ncbi:Mpp10 protein [Lentithecium fluviatile CBS 122367]|uniref:Mpp10 protein n=1 Tax=Lentithecium fluviatile CBS 122367 TaxID=1168545 RepID=A0A6G1IGB2_9PLEO|nr:Mpp10 protein [Lentithecium fluviatile CBS 122367]
MAPPSFSPEASISSHTLSAGSGQPPPMDLQTADSAPAALLTSPLAFLQPTTQLNASFLAAAKRFLDPVAAGVSQTQSQRQQELRRKRKRGAVYDGDISVLHLKKVHLQGFGVNQVFEQTRKIIAATTEEIELSLPQDKDGPLAIQPDNHDEASEDGMDGIGEDESSSDIGEEGVDWEYEGEDVLDDNDAELDGGEGLLDESSAEEDVEMEDGEGASFFDDASEDAVAEEYRPDPHGLNDGFFEIDQFNKITDFLEQQDNRGEAAGSGDEEIDWEGDPFATNGVKKPAGAGDVDMGEEDSDEDGSTFGIVDLEALDSDDDELEDGDMDDMGDTNANNIMYADFFAPPAKKAGRNKKKRGRPNPHNFPSAADPQNNKPDEGDMEATMSRVHRDLFEDDDDAESDGDLTDLDPSDPKSRRSTHERRQAKIAEQIRKLEAANVAKRQWQLAGEARAADRPINSLLEEDLEYERAGKPVPVITAEVSEDIEALIKHRILAGEFDEVQRRRPDDLATGPKVRRGRFELDDTKATKGLAEIYEEEHLRNTDPNFVDARDEKLKTEHAEISEMWKSICGKLDSLSSSHFKPKPATANLEIRVDAPAIEMEDARPTAGGEVAGASMLAPQELYKPGEDKDAVKTEIVTKGGQPIAREELTREQKLRRRRREKERIKKAGLHQPEKTETRKQKKDSDKKQLLGDLKKGGVQVIGKKGQLTDVEGKEVRSEGPRKGAGSYKL